VGNVLRTIGSAWAWIAIAVVVVAWFPTILLVWAVTAPFDPGRYAVGWWYRRMGVAMAKVNPFWHFSARGVRIEDPRRPYVVVSNHESFADIMLISHVGWEMKWMSKIEIMRIPFAGWGMWFAGDIAFRRETARGVLEAFRGAQRVLKNRVSVMIFPEGTRSATGAMLPFKDGAFKLAIDGGYPVLPLAVAGTGAALPKHDWRFHRTRAIVEVLPPVETAGMTGKDLPELKERVRASIEAARDALRREIGEA